MRPESRRAAPPSRSSCSSNPRKRSPASVAGRRGAPPDDATRQDLGSEYSAPLTRRGRIPQQCCRWQLCCLACNGTTRAKASAFNVRRSYFGHSTRARMRPVLRSLRNHRRTAFAPGVALGEASRSAKREGWWSRRASHPGPIRLSPRVYRHSPVARTSRNIGNSHLEGSGPTASRRRSPGTRCSRAAARRAG